LRRAATPTDVNTGYGYMNWFLNTDGKRLPSAPVSSVYHAGGVGDAVHIIWVDPDHDLVVVVRWLQSPELDPFLKRVIAAVVPGAAGGGGAR
jgi:CubicO group peptidase (beta-lactamase class C family)